MCPPGPRSVENRTILPTARAHGGAQNGDLQPRAAQQNTSAIPTSCRQLSGIRGAIWVLGHATWCALSGKYLVAGLQTRVDRSGGSRAQCKEWNTTVEMIEMIERINQPHLDHRLERGLGIEL
jgi:hypothetical protein